MYNIYSHKVSYGKQFYLQSNNINIYSNYIILLFIDKFI